MRKLLIAAVEGADVGPVSSVDPHVCAQVEVQRKPFSAAFKSTLKEEQSSSYYMDQTVCLLPSPDDSLGISKDISLCYIQVLVSIQINI